MNHPLRPLWLLASFLLVPTHGSAQTPVTQAPDSASEANEMIDALRRGTEFMRGTVADHGGYAWVSSHNGVHSHGEGIAGPHRVWVQPPGTPAVAATFLDAYEATGHRVHLQAALAAGEALIDGQLRSGGWGYSIPFSRADREGIPFRVGPLGDPSRIVPTPAPGGWDVWKRREHGANKTMLDDDTTAAAIRFLARLDQHTEFRRKEIHESVAYALRSTLRAQYPIGAWGHNYDRFPTRTADVEHYPIVAASFPDEWSRTWTKDFRGCYMINDRITHDMIRTMWLAWEIYQRDDFRDAAVRGGEFLLLAQLPQPSPAWAQQYDRMMRPVWDRSFEPPAVSAGESQDTLDTLLDLYAWTGEERFLEPVPRAITYLRSLQRPDGNLARFYELKANTPIYFDREYKITSDDSDVPDHYGFVVPSRLDAIETRYRRLRESGPPADPPALGRDGLDESGHQSRDHDIAAVLRSQRSDGAWLTPGFVRDTEGKKVTPDEGVVDSQVFIDNFRRLCDAMIRAGR